MRFTYISPDTFQKLQRNAGIICTSFNPSTGAFSGILGATTGGIQFSAAPSYTDFGDDIDNCPKNMMELKNLDTIEVTMSGTLLTIDAATAKKLVGAADIDQSNSGHIIPRRDLLTSDFHDLWWIGDYSDENSSETGGFCAIHMKNALNTGGFQIQSSDKAKGQFAFTFTGHVSMNAQNVVPYEIYIQSGVEDEDPSISVNKHTMHLAVNEEETLVATTYNTSATVSFVSDDTDKVTVNSETGVVKGVAAGSATVTASIEDNDIVYTDTCTVIVTAG